MSETTERAAAAVPLKVTWVAPVKFVPVMVTAVPTGPLVGVNTVIIGGPTIAVVNTKSST